jgi:cytoskeletal protein CcmA (bactofilin family)
MIPGFTTDLSSIDTFHSFAKGASKMGFFGKKDKEERSSVAPGPTVQTAAAKSQKKDVTQDTTYFGKNLKIKGNVSGEGSLIILGSFEGQFNLKGRLKVARGAEITGNIKATDIYINGNVEGKLVASKKVHLDNTARVKGGIASPSISVLEGALFDGEVKMSNRTTQASKPAAAEPAQSPPASVAPQKNVTEL